MGQEESLWNQRQHRKASAHGRHCSWACAAENQSCHTLAEKLCFPGCCGSRAAASQTYGIPIPKYPEPDSNPSSPANPFTKTSARRAPHALCRHCQLQTGVQNALWGWGWVQGEQVRDTGEQLSKRKVCSVQKGVAVLARAGGILREAESSSYPCH